MEQRDIHPIPYEEFLEHSRAKNSKWIDGVIDDLAGTSVHHGRIVRDPGNALFTYLDGKLCEAL